MTKRHRTIITFFYDIPDFGLVDLIYTRDVRDQSHAQQILTETVDPSALFKRWRTAERWV